MTAEQDPTRRIVRTLVADIEPHDDRERADRVDTLRWIDSGAPLYRLRPPATPPRHLVVYFVPFDETTRSVLLVDHVKAGLWLPPGGHVDPGEDPRRTVEREAREELDIAAVLHRLPGRTRPFFLTVTPTRGPDPHVDTSLWFLLDLRRGAPIRPDPGEFRSVAWRDLDGGVEWAGQGCDPELPRFLAKLDAACAVPGVPA